MAIDVLMPQMGESVAEGTIVRWIKQVGDAIGRDEPLFEISTDKVDAEIPAPEAGVLLEIRVKEGETVPVNSIVAVIGSAGAQAKPSASAPAGHPPVSTPQAGKAADGDVRGLSETSSRAADAAAPAATSAPSTAAAEARMESEGGPPPTPDEFRRTRSSPVVRRMAKTHGVDISRIAGTGVAGRVTKKDVDAHLAKSEGPGSSPASCPRPGLPLTENRVEKMSVMRRKIAEHMLASVKISPHVYSAVEVDFGRIEELRQVKKAAYETAGTRLTHTAFIAKATADTIREFPFANASVDGEQVTYHRDVNLGIAVALDHGLIVPVIRSADTRSMTDLCRAIQDLGQRARTKHLQVDEVQAGTFTITNPGVFGVIYGMPIISQPQVAILAVGAIEKRVVVVGDMIAIRPMAYLTLAHDHRLIDGADAGRFLQALKRRLQEFDASLL